MGQEKSGSVPYFSLAEIIAGLTLAALLAIIVAGLLILARIIGLGFLADFQSRTVRADRVPDRGRLMGDPD
jgi:MFS superfamily sulfate permease-like transporter